MKKITLFLFTLLISCSAWGATPEKLYLTPNSNWNQSNARFAAYFFGNGEKWISMTKVEGETNLYEVSVPSGYPSVIFCRMNPSTSTNNWNNKWNQTSDLTIPTSGTNYYTVTEGAWDKGGGTWTTYAPEAPKTYKDITITITATSRPKIHYWDGGDKMTGSSWDTKPDMVATGVTNTYSYTINQVDAAIGVHYLIVVGDIQTADQHTTENVNANFKDFLPQVIVRGITDWNETDRMIVSDDYNSASITLPLTKKTYDWKITVNGDWRGGSSYTITRKSNTCTMSSNVDGDGKLTADMEGDYVFTYTYADEKLTVTYPTYTVTVSSNNTSWGEATILSHGPSGEFAPDDTPTLKALPKNGYAFVGWYNGENCISTDATYKPTVTSNLTLEAKFIETHTVTLTAGKGGAVKGSGTYKNGETATITATPNNGYHFVRWSDGETDAERKIEVTEDLDLYAEFEINTYRVDINTADGGYVEGAGTYDHGDNVTITATANESHIFDGWYDEKDELVSKEATYSFQVKSNKTFTPKFTIRKFTVSISTNNAKWGTVSGGGEVEYDSSVDLSAEPKDGYNFDGWYENSNLISSEPNYTYYNITEHKEIVAKFSPKYFHITIEESKEGQLIDPNTKENVSAGDYAYGTEFIIEAVPNNGYEFVEWEDKTTANPRTFTVTGEATISATYKAKTYTVTLSADPAEGGYVDGAGTYEYDSYINIYATPNEGYRFVRWSDGDENQSRDFLVERDIKLTAHFELIKYIVDIYAQDGGNVVGTDEKEYPYGTRLTFEAVPAPGYEFIKWSDDNTDNPRTIIVEEDINGLYPIFELKDVVFTNETDLEFATYGHLTYQLTMDENRWYWIVLPYNVKVEDITTSTGGGWNDLVFTEYDAQRRADSGDGWINWKTAGKDIAAETLTANKGYVIGPKDGPFKQDGDFVVTFPSASPTNDVTASAKASATRTGDGKNDNWNIIGTGLYHPTTKLGNINYIAVPDTNSASYYKYYYVGEASGFFQTPLNHTFKPFEAFFVQYGGDYSATADLTKSAAELAPVARAKAQEQEQIYLINMNEARTVVILNAEGSEGYTAGEDFLEMNLGSRIEMIYSFDGTDALAFNHRATEAQSIALGGYVATAGEQTISLNAYNSNAEAVTLIDNLTGETADLLAGNYTFTAEVGSIDGRFTIVFAAQKAGGVTTDCYNSVANQVIAYGTADHCTVNGLTAGKAIAIYNTMGQLVFATIADSETITLPSLTAGNYLILHNGTTNKVALR